MTSSISCIDHCSSSPVGSPLHLPGSLKGWCSSPISSIAFAATFDCSFRTAVAIAADIDSNYR